MAQIMEQADLKVLLVRCAADFVDLAPSLLTLSRLKAQIMFWKSTRRAGKYRWLEDANTKLGPGKGNGLVSPKSGSSISLRSDDFSEI